MTSHELVRKLLHGPDLPIQIALRNNNPKLEEVEEVTHVIFTENIYLVGNSEKEWVKGMLDEWGTEKVLF